MSCLFCSDNLLGAAVLENPFAYAVYDKFPKEKGHMLIIPKDHSENFFDTNLQERFGITSLLDQAKEYLDEKYKPDGYNVVLNCGKAAGQEIFHTHVHLIPRYA